MILLPCKSLFTSFLENGILNLKLINEYYNEQALKDVGDVAHKMLTPFSQLGDNPVIPILMKLERMSEQELQHEEQDELMVSLNHECGIIFKTLNEAIV